MPAISATRHEVSDRFEMLGFSIKTGRKPYFQVVLISELEALRDKTKRTPPNFWASGPIVAERGEAVFLVPPEVLKRFAGQPRLYYGLATFADANRREPEIVSEPSESSPWVNLGAYTGRSHRRAMTLRPPSRGETGNGYGAGKPEDLEWAGDIARPGTKIIPTAPAGDARRNASGKANGNGRGKGNDKGNGNGRTTTATPSPSSADLAYDDGFGEMPVETTEESIEDYGIDGPLEEGDATSQGLAYGRALTTAPEYPGTSDFIEARHFQRPAQPRSIRRIVIHITDGHGPARGTADYFADPQRWYRVDEENGELQMEFDGDRCARFRAGGKWKDCVGGKTKVENNRTVALARLPVSAHYVVGQGGEVIQMVRNANIAYHASSANGDSIGIEHGARSPGAFGKNDTGLFPTDVQYRESAKLVCWLANCFSIPKDRTHILGHSEADPNTTHAQCPNAVWDWGKFMALVTDGSCDPASASAPAAQTYAAPRRSAAQRLSLSLGDESFAVFWNDVELVPQMTNMSCWAASAAMVVGWRDQISIDPQEIANGTGVWGAYQNGLWPRDHAALAEAWGLVKEPPQSYTVESWRQLIEQNGPLWLGVAVPSGHAVVVIGLSGDGTPEGTTVYYHDPWPPGQGAKNQTKSFATFIREYENRVTTNGGTVNVQVIHSGGTGNRQVSSSAQSFARALELVGFTGDGVVAMRQEFEANKAAGSPKNCITITNAGLRKLYGASLKTDAGGDKALGSTCQDTMAQLVSYGLAESPTTFEFNDSRGRLTKGVIRPETLQQSVESWLTNEAQRIKACAWYIFGLSIMDGYHSVVLALDFCGVGDPLTKLYWCDQIYSGWDEVTGSLDARIEAKTQAWWDPLPADRKARTRITVWPLLPGEIAATTHGLSIAAHRETRTVSRPMEIQVRTLPFNAPPPGSNPGSMAAPALNAAGAFAGAPTLGAFKLPHADVASRLTALINNPDAIYQSKLNLCGPAAYFNILLRRDPVSFARYAIDLFKTGAGVIGGLSVEAGGDLKAQTYLSSWGCPPTDWMAMSALRDSENAVTDYEGTPDEDVAGMTTPAELANWLAATGLYTSVSDEGNWIFTKGVPHALGLSPGTSTDIALLINAHILDKAAAAAGKKSSDLILSAFPNHFVVLKTPIVDSSGLIEFDCWTWGGILPVSVNRDTFDANYYGAVIATV